MELRHFLLPCYTMPGGGGARVKCHEISFSFECGFSLIEYWLSCCKYLILFQSSSKVILVGICLFGVSTGKQVLENPSLPSYWCKSLNCIIVLKMWSHIHSYFNLFYFLIYVILLLFQILWVIFMVSISL